MLLVFATLFLPARAFGDEPFTLESASKTAFNDLPETFRRLLDPNGTRVVTSYNGQMTNLMEFWWCKAVPAADRRSKQTRAVYGEVMQGALLGVLRFLPDTPEDFREDSSDHKITPGFYAMRYVEPTPGSGEDEDSRYPDAAALIPIASDPASESISPEEALQLSALATKGKKPALLNMPSANTVYKSGLIAIADDAGLCTLQFSTRLNLGKSQAKDLILAIIVVTPKKEDGES